MDFALTPEQDEMRRTALRVARSFDNDYWQKIDSESVFPRAYWDAVVAHGFAGVAVDAEYGGSGIGLLDLSICIEALSNSPAGMGGGGAFVAGPVFGGFLIGKQGTAGQKGPYPPATAK